MSQPQTPSDQILPTQLIDDPYVRQLRDENERLHQRNEALVRRLQRRDDAMATIAAVVARMGAEKGVEG